jgi:hypothetical protein
MGHQYIYDKLWFEMTMNGSQPFQVCVKFILACSIAAFSNSTACRFKQTKATCFCQMHVVILIWKDMKLFYPFSASSLEMITEIAI